MAWDRWCVLLGCCTKSQWNCCDTSELLRLDTDHRRTRWARYQCDEMAGPIGLAGQRRLEARRSIRCRNVVCHISRFPSGAKVDPTRSENPYSSRPNELRRSLPSTNIIESKFAHSGHVIKKARRWRVSEHTQRCTATVFLVV